MQSIRIPFVVAVLALSVSLFGCATYVANDNVQSFPSASDVSASSLSAVITSPERSQREFRETYARISENAFLSTAQAPYSTFAADVDTASYANVRRFLSNGEMPPPDAVRIEEMVNYFRYAYSLPGDEAPLAASCEVADSPWAPEHRLVRIGLQSRAIDMSARLRTNLVFLLDVSGSMMSPDKLPLLKRGMQMLVRNLDKDDSVGIVVYAGESRVVQESVRCTPRNKEKLLQHIAGLEAGGSTAGGAGIQEAYSMAQAHMVTTGVNRVILATDGDFNVGISDRDQLVEFIEEKAKTGVFLTVLGFGEGNLKDASLEQIADHGNGHYAYIDSITEARKVLLEEMGATIVTVAKDVKIQVEFNPARVGAYRLLGYENRLLAAEDFNDDAKDAGEIGAGHSVTALYEIVPPDKVKDVVDVDPLRYQQPDDPSDFAGSNELLHLKVRYKQPKGIESELLSWVVSDTERSFDVASDDFRFAASVAAFGMLLRDSKHKGNIDYDEVIAIALQSKGVDAQSYRAEFVTLVRNAKALTTEISGKKETARSGG